MVSIKNIDSLKHVKLEYKKNKYPVPCDPYLPKMYFVSLFVGSRGSGKTYSACQLLKLYENHGIIDVKLRKMVDQRIILISPSYSANPVWTSLKHLDEKDIYHSYSENKLIQIVDDIQQVDEEIKEYQRKLKIYKKFLKHNRDLKHMTPEEIHELHKTDGEPPDLIKYPNGVVNFLILDDMVGSSAFKNGKSSFNSLCIKNRHLKINIIIMSQNLKSIPKIIRNNVSVFVIFKFASKKIITEDLYEEVSNIITLSLFEEIFDMATDKEHGSLVVDFTADKDDRFKIGWDKLIHF